MTIETMSNILILSLIVFLLEHESLANSLCSESVSKLCECRSQTIRCSHKNLNEYPDMTSIQHSIQHLDVSFNQLKTFPRNLQQLILMETLDLSHNQIESIPNDIKYPVNLRHLILSYNNISNWLNINPNNILQSAINLHTLNLAGNPLRSFSGNDERLLLISNSLQTLDLSNCQILKINGPLVLSGLLNLEHLILKENPLHTLPDLKANRLLSLDISACKLTTLRRTVFLHMPILTYVNLSQNHRLSLYHSNDEYVESLSLRRIDLSKCNMNSVELKGFPNLTTVILNGNLITQLNVETFENNILIENLDLSYNAINHISVMAFQLLKCLRNLDISFNMIRQIEADTFKDNQQLTSINLSRNYIERLRRIKSNSLTYLNMSWCEIVKIDDDAFNDLPELIEMDLSNNLFSEIPSQLNSRLLQILDLSRCRLSSIDNDTFATFPELSRLNLVGNRLTITLRTEYFINNQYLNEIWLGDNPWRCECQQNGFHQFFRYLIEYPARIRDRSQLRCHAPENAHGKLWEIACYNEWYTNTRQMNMIERIWTIIMIILINLTILYCSVSGMKRYVRYRKEQRQEEERQGNLEAARELMRHNRMVLEQESQLNAPDPRENHPPCYEDAILLPRLDTSFASLKRAGLLTDNYDETFHRAKRARCRSEEAICIRDTSVNKNRRHILTARLRKTKQQTTNLSKSLVNMSKMSSEQYETNPKHEQVNNQKPIDGDLQTFATLNECNFELIDQLETVDGHSPYAKRKTKQTSQLIVPVASTSAALLNQPNNNKNGISEIVIIENHYRSENSLNTLKFTQQRRSLLETYAASCSTLSSSSLDSGDYTKLSNNEIFTTKRSDI